jgi:hypothetical protein
MFVISFLTCHTSIDGGFDTLWIPLAPFFSPFDYWYTCYKKLSHFYLFMTVIYHFLGRKRKIK